MFKPDFTHRPIWKCLFTALLLSISLLFLIAPVNAATFNVSDADQLSQALSDAVRNGENDLVKIQQGTYVGNFVYNSTEPFGVSIEGGYGADFDSRVVDANNTILDGNQTGTVLVLYSTQGVKFQVDGITLQNGNESSHGGGGLYSKTEGSGELVLTNNTITGNNSSYGGGGVYISSYSSGIFTKNTITGNSSSSSSFYLGGGGGICLNSSSSIALTSNTITGNSSRDGGGICINYSSSITLTNNSITSNSYGGSGGGGICIYNSSSITLTNNNITDNSSSSYSGGGVTVSSSSSITLNNNTIIGNTSSRGGGGISVSSVSSSSISITNNNIAKNIGSYGGGVYISLNKNSVLNIYNNIFWNNTATNQGNDLYINNDKDHNFVADSKVNLYNNNFDHSASSFSVQIPFTIDPSNLNNQDPLFVDAENGNYSLSEGSPCIDTGNNDAPELPDTDIAGDPRIQDGTVDMGAYEYPGDFILSPTLSISSNVSTGDAPFNVSFTSSVSSGTSPYTYSWDFGDNTSESTDQNPTHEYESSGSYTATLTVTDDNGNTVTDTIAITATVPVIPNLEIAASSTANLGVVSLSVKFLCSVQSGAPPYTFSWDFGDNTAENTDQNPSHKYESSGSYTATVTVTDASNNTASDTVSITINTSDSQYEAGKQFCIDYPYECGLAYYNDTEKVQFSVNEHYYQRFNISMGWHQAKKYCESLGGHLATITSEEEEQFIRTNLVEIQSIPMWIGASDENTEGVWEWVTGEVWDFTYWLTSPVVQPDNFGDIEHFLQYSTDGWGWNDIGTGEYGSYINGTLYPSGFICEWDEYKPLLAQTYTQAELDAAKQAGYDKGISEGGQCATVDPESLKIDVACADFMGVCFSFSLNFNPDDLTGLGWILDTSTLKTCTENNDKDNDGFEKDVDCDDSNPSVHPGATEIPGNGIDEDCSPSIFD